MSKSIRLLCLVTICMFTKSCRNDPAEYSTKIHIAAGGPDIILFMSKSLPPPRQHTPAGSSSAKTSTLSRQHALTMMATDQAWAVSLPNDFDLAHSLFVAAFRRAILRASERLANIDAGASGDDFAALKKQIQEQGFGLMFSTPQFSPADLGKPFEFAIFFKKFTAKSTPDDFGKFVYPSRRGLEPYDAAVFPSWSSGRNVLVAPVPNPDVPLPDQHIVQGGHFAALLA